MTNIQIKGVPERTHAVLRKRAAAAHQSLREYLLQHLIEEADRPTLDEVLDSAGCGTGGSVSLMRSMPSSARTVIVTDAGVLIATFVDDGAWGDTARARLRHEEIAAPELIDLEVTSAFAVWHAPERSTSGALSSRLRNFVVLPCIGHRTMVLLCVAGSFATTFRCPTRATSHLRSCSGSPWLPLMPACLARRRSCARLRFCP
jgi:hypothetical protein